MLRCSARRLHDEEINRYRSQWEQAQTSSSGDRNSRDEDLRQARLQADLSKSARSQLEQAQDQNQR